MLAFQAQVVYLAAAERKQPGTGLAESKYSIDCFPFHALLPKILTAYEIYYIFIDIIKIRLCHGSLYYNVMLYI